jgi:hypothetical protein
MSTKPSSEETADLQGAFPRLSDAEIAALDAQGQRRPIQPNDVLFAAGDGEAALEAVTVTDNRTGTRCTIDARGAALADDTQAWLPLLFGGIGVALARTFALIDAELKAVHTRDWERTFELFRLLI